MRHSARIAACLLLLTQVHPTVAQDVRPQDAGFTIRTSVQEVILDLTVRDSHGKMVKNLQPGEVEIYEDGVRQQVRNFRLVAGREAVQQVAKAEEEKAAMGMTAARTNPLPATNLVCIVFHNLTPDTRQFAIAAAQEFIKNELQPATWVGIFSLDSKLTALHPFTMDRNELTTAAGKAFAGRGVDLMNVADAVLSADPFSMSVQVTTTGNPASGGSVSSDMVASGGGLNKSAIIGAEVSNSAGANIARGERASERRQFGDIEGMRQTDQIIAMIERLKTLPGRKTILFYSTGLATTGDPDRFDKILEKANKAQVSVYAIDINGLTQNSNVLASTAALSHAAAVSRTQARVGDSAAAMMEKMRQGDYVQNAVRTTDTQASLRALAEGTGGFLIGSTNDLRKPYQKVLEDVDTHYEAIYRPVSDKYDGRLRTIDVKLTRAGLTVESRKGYFALPALGTPAALMPFEMSGLAALNARPLPHAFNFRSAVFEFRPSAAGTQQALAIELPAYGLTATPLPEAKKGRIHVAVVALIKDASGQVVSKFSKEAPFEIPEENLAAMRGSALTFTYPVELPPGRYTAETAVVDLEAKRASTMTTMFDSVERQGVGLSSIVLVRGVEGVNLAIDAADPFEFQPQGSAGQRVVPELVGELSAEAKPSVYFVVYPNKSSEEKPKIRVEFLVGGRVLARQTAELPPADSTGAIPMVVAAATRPGECELRITAMQGTATATRSLHYKIGGE